jgi:DNA mismatch repair ATPase MutS
MEPRAHYMERRKHFDALIKEQEKGINLISNLRLLTFVIGAGMAIYLYFMKNYTAAIFLLTAAVIIFAYLVFRHNRVAKEKKYSTTLYKINDDALKRLKGEWREFEDNGEEFIDGEHRYTSDLDVFGKGSLFQWINSSYTYTGRRVLREALENPLSSAEDIYKRQRAICELSDDLVWRQDLMAEAIMICDSEGNPDELYKWSENINATYLNEGRNLFFKILPVVTVIIIILSFIGNIVPSYLRSISIIIHILLLLPGNAVRAHALDTVYKYKKSIKLYESMIKLIESKAFKSDLLKDLKGCFDGGENNSASKYLSELQKISEKTGERNNFFYIVINILFLWDYQCMFALEGWKKKHGMEIRNWINAIGSFEMLNSFTNIKQDYIDWALPVVDNNKMIFVGKNLGHPLISDKCICNDLSINDSSKMLLITGSNMSGKSTLLRTAGTNLLLAQLGMPVCASSLQFSIMDIYTCMRIGDNLERSISSFYAEILRIKKIMSAVKDGKKIFVILDEIFKGTNSFDRHMGAKYLIKMLLKEKTIGLVSTHDLELGELEGESKSEVKNYHFREYYEEDKLRFDYKLRSGISTTRNAMYLIKMAGIDVEHDSENA